MKLLRAISRLVIGFTFIFSGFVKIIDPVGFGLILAEYFKVVGIGSFPFLYQTLGVALSGVELLLGISVLLGLRMKISSRLVLWFISGFTVLTLMLAIFNPVKECGCFGEAIKLTNWQTFYKNIFLLGFALVLFFHRNKFIPIAPKNWEWSFAAAYALLILFLAVYSYRYLPLIDFLDFKVGTDIPEKLSMAEIVGEPSYQTVLIYKKDGKLKEFMIDQLPDSTWEFVDSKTKKVLSESLPTALNFAISDRDGNYITDSLMSRNGKLFITAIPYFERLSTSDIEKLLEISKKLKDNNLKNIVLTGSSFWMIDSLNRNFPDSNIYYTDNKTLLSLNRSNGGLVYFNNGVVTAKWSINNLPVESLNDILKEDPELLAAKARIKEQLAAEVAAIIILLLIVIMRYICRFAYTHKFITDENSSEQKPQGA